MRFTLAALALVSAAAAAPAHAATNFPVAHTRARNVDMVLVKVSPSFFAADLRTQERWYTDLQACVRRVKLAGTVVAVGQGGGGSFRFYGPNSWHDFLRSIDMAWVNARVNKQMSCQF